MAAEACAACGREILTPYCPHCGEKRASDRTHSVGEFVREHVIEAAVNLDGRVIRSLRALVTKPGLLTAEFMRGVRLRYLPPLQLFLLLNVGFFFWSAIQHQTIFDTPLRAHLGRNNYAATARRMVKEKLAQTKEDSAAFERRFNTVGNTQARTLILSMIPIFGILVAVVTLGRRRYPLVQHLVFSLHAYSALFIIIPLTFLLALIVIRGVWLPLGLPYRSSASDTVLSYSISTLFGLYLAIAFRRAYALGRARAALSAVLLATAMFVVLAGYRALLFFVTFRSV